MRDYWIEFSVKCAEDDEVGTGMGGRIGVDNPEHFDRYVEMYSGFLKEQLLKSNEREVERDREAAKPFWMKWLGG